MSGVSNASNADAILSQAREREREYGWLGAAESYIKALGLTSEQDFSKLAEVQERIGYAFHRAAMQAEGVEEFRERMLQAVENYEKAKEFYGRLSGEGITPRMLRCEAMIAYTGYWLASNVPEKKRLLAECWQRTKDALNAFLQTRDASEFGKTYNQLSSAVDSLQALEWDFQAGEKIVKEAMEYGEQTVTQLSAFRDVSELARAYVKTAFWLARFSKYFVPDEDEKARCSQKSYDYWQKASELSEEAALLELLSVSDTLNWNVTDSLVHLYEKALGCAKKTKDKYLIGTALDILAFASFMKSLGTDDPDKVVEYAQKALKCAEDAKQQLSSISFVSPRIGALWMGAPHAEYHWVLANWETDLSKRRDLLEQAVMYGTQGITQAEITGYPGVLLNAHHVLSKTLASLAQIETNSEKKKRLLEKALEHRNETIRLIEQIQPFFYWNLGVLWNYLADLKAELSDVEKDSESRKNMLEEAVSNKERGLELCIKEISYWEKGGDLASFGPLGRYQYSYGELLTRLYGLTNNNEHKRKAIKAFEDTAESFKKLNLACRIAECYWKAAQGCDDLGEHLKAAENFNLASNNYASAAEKIPQLKDFYHDHAVYMQAWSEIEEARHHHARQEYGLAKEHFEKAGELHKPLKQWSYLAHNYSAWAELEQAEELSRKEQDEEALQAFEKAAKLFSETKASLQIELSKIENLDEKQMATSIAKATGLRHEYCIARIALEEARILDNKGDHASSLEKYNSAAKTFEKITEALESEQDRKEIKLIVTLTRAWQKMAQAETEASPTLYLEASKLFEEAKELCSIEKEKVLALGHSRFCRAKEAGTRFADTRDINLHAAAIMQLESAANYYMKAGFQNAAEYAKATELLFDAYVYMGNAKVETDPEKKTKLYMLSEKVLQTSASSFMKAEHPEKREQVLKLLETVKEEREFAVSLIDVFHAPIIGSTTAFLPPTPTYEKAAGLEKFEHAEIQAKIITHQKELHVGDNFNLEIELVNAGKGPALLNKIVQVFPEGFEILEKPEMCRIEDGCLNLKGKRLDPLKIEELKLLLKPKVKGVFTVEPKILYLDENGKYKSHEPQPITVSVKELGIKGWLKGQ
jgi:hypothetical protein